jgi:hypothetical protein
MSIAVSKYKVMEMILWACFDDPELFVREVLGASPTDQQVEGLRAVGIEGSKVTIRSGHNTGKTAELAWLILWFLLTRYDCKIPITAPTSSQLRDTLWPELHRWRDKLPLEMREEVEITTERIYIKSAPQMQFGVPRTAKKENPEALQGFHAKHLMYIIDEASGVDDVIFEVARAGLSNPGARIVMAGNPIRTAGYFYASHHEHRDRWTVLHWSCLDSPLPAVEYGEDVAKDYGVDSNFYRVRVLGEFPTAEADQLIALELLEAAVVREGVIAEGPIIWGLDPAWLGDAETALAKRQGDVISGIEAVRGLDTMQVTGWLIDKYEAAEEKPETIVVDMIGIGAGVHDRLVELGYPVIGCNVAESPSSKEKYINMRADLWDRYKLWLQSRRGRLPSDNRLIGQSSVIRYGFSSSGKMQIESKAEMRRRGVQSPDRADAVCLTFYHEPLMKKSRKRPRQRIGEPIGVLGL